MALNSSILACTLADKTTPSYLPTFPKVPFKDENTAQCEGMTEEQINAERLRAYCFFKTLGKRR